MSVRISVTLAIVTVLAVSPPGIESVMYANPILQCLSNAGPQFQTLIKVMNESGVADSMTSLSSWTLLAPDDDAFAKLSTDTKSQLLSGKNDTVAPILGRLTIPNQNSAKDLEQNKEAKSISGDTLTFRIVSRNKCSKKKIFGREFQRCKNEKVLNVNGVADVVKKDIHCNSKGIVQEIDTVILK
ncbi:FAS1 domain-containing protein [Plasmodiophora brassicae]|uniref:FAS1 domain-containing protein n=1 Tax=Plasmodiophora brassicae TaxID=37360 RepID=A0A0G4IYP4_PLABS|nr:hypothetical protein PBRA_001436 [Plasmodiophora brassicae]SPQ94108.1 unnamed protein product [Plasmodiophora brassicae]